VETTAAGILEHDGVYQKGEFRNRSRFDPQQTLVIASCDPAAGLLAAEVNRLRGLRVIPLIRSSQQALALLHQGLVHVAGVHLATNQSPDANVRAVQDRLGPGFRLLRVAQWQEGIALSPGSAVRTVQAAMRSKLRWIGRESGSGARQCLDELLDQRPPPRRIAPDHRGVAEAIRYGWGDAGVCLRLVSEEAGLRFLTVRKEIYELCFPSESESDPRIHALKETVRSASYQNLLDDLPGYDASECGEMQTVPFN
jgi:molybdate-binding protein